MPEQVRCPECNAALRVPENLLGRTVKCPKCQTTFTAETEEPAAPHGITREPVPARRSRVPEEAEEEESLEEEEYEERARRRGRRRRSSRMAKSAVIGPAISIIVVSSLSIVLGLGDLAFRVLGFGMSGRAGGAPLAQLPGYSAGIVLGGIFDALSVIVPIVMLVGAFKMKNLQNHGLALATCILALAPLHCCCLLGLPFGIWGLVMLNKPEVKDAFS